MRSETEMYALILQVAQSDERIRAAMAFGFPYPAREDERASAYLQRIRRLPREAKTTGYPGLQNL